MPGETFASLWNDGVAVLHVTFTQGGSRARIKYYSRRLESEDYEPDYASLVHVEKDDKIIYFDMGERFANFERRVSVAARAFELWRYRGFTKWHRHSDRKLMRIYKRAEWVGMRGLSFLDFCVLVHALKQWSGYIYTCSIIKWRRDTWIRQVSMQYTGCGFTKWVREALRWSVNSIYLNHPSILRFAELSPLRGALRRWDTFARTNKSLTMAKLLVREERDNKLKASRKHTKKKKGRCVNEPPNIQVKPLANVTLDAKGESIGNAQTSVASALACVVCFQNHSEFAVVPCGHRCLCETCAQTVQSKYDSCPMCRNPVSMIIRIYG